METEVSRIMKIDKMCPSLIQVRSVQRWDYKRAVFVYALVANDMKTAVIMRYFDHKEFRHCYALAFAQE